MSVAASVLCSRTLDQGLSLTFSFPPGMRLLQLEEIARLDCWVQFLQTYSDPGGSGRAESATDEAESGWWVVEEALAWRKRAKENNEFEDGVSDSRGRYGVQDGGNIGACHWAEELRTLVWGGVPSGLRGEV